MGKTDALVRVVFWMVLLFVTGSVWMRDGRHFVQEREASIAKMKAAAAAAPQPVKVDAAEATRPASVDAHSGSPSAAVEEEEFDSFEEPATDAGASPASVGAGNKVHVQFCHG